MQTAEKPRASTARRRAVPLLTYETFLHHAPDGTKEDLIDGVGVPAMSASTTHERLFAFLLTVLRGYASAKGLGEVLGSRTLVRIDARNGYEPDLLFVSKARAHIVRERDVTEAPDIAVEIVSKSSRRRDARTKFLGYERAGVLEYWLIDPERRAATFYVRGDQGVFEPAPLDGGVFASHALPGFRLDPAWLFADPLPPEFAVLRGLLGA